MTTPLLPAVAPKGQVGRPKEQPCEQAAGDRLVTGTQGQRGAVHRPA